LSASFHPPLALRVHGLTLRAPSAFVGGCCTKPPRCVVVVDISNASRQDRVQLSRARRHSRRSQRRRGALPRASTDSAPTVLLWGRAATAKQDGTTLGVSPTREVCATATLVWSSRSPTRAPGSSPASSTTHSALDSLGLAFEQAKLQVQLTFNAVRRSDAVVADGLDADTLVIVAPPDYDAAV
jgi:hypothetical protein